MTAFPIVVLGCGSKKNPGKHRAIDLYVGMLFIDQLEIARVYGGPHYILSGLHGLVSVDRVLESYEFSLKTASVERVKKFDALVLQQLSFMPPGRPLICLIGKRYSGWVDAARVRGFTIQLPLAGKTLVQRRLIGAEIRKNRLHGRSS